ncbi:MAG: hypothetical protein P1U32_03845 [Legionellaceae bacterium]|nr:hypothetical protein [Legionellaceae bacterium]
MYEFLTSPWFGSDNKKTQPDDVVQAEVGPCDAFIEALVRGDSATYTSPDYAVDVELMTPQILLRLLRSNATEAFIWALQQKTFDLDKPVADEEQALSLLSYAVERINADCFAALAKQNPQAVLLVPTELLTRIQKSGWEAFFKVVERSLSPQTAAIRYLNLARRVAIDEANLREPYTGRGTDYRVPNLNRHKERLAKVLEELTGFEEISFQKDDEPEAKAKADFRCG